MKLREKSKVQRPKSRVQRLWTLDFGLWTSPAAPAFTLLELLIAVSIFAIVLAAINGVFYGAMRLQRTATRSVEAAFPLQQTLAILKRDLQGIVAPGGMLAGALQPSSASTANANLL